MRTLAVIAVRSEGAAFDEQPSVKQLAAITMTATKLFSSESAIPRMVRTFSVQSSRISSDGSTRQFRCQNPQPLAGAIQWPTIRIEGSKRVCMFSSVIDFSLTMVNGPKDGNPSYPEVIADLKQEPTEETGGWSVSLTELFLQHNHRENYVLELKAELPE